MTTQRAHTIMRVTSQMGHDKADDWRDQAQCRDTDPTLFHPERNDPASFDDARTICADCPVKAACLAYALDKERGLHPDVRWGMFGGLTSDERADLDGFPMKEACGNHTGTDRGARAHRRNRQRLCVECLAAERSARAANATRHPKPITHGTNAGYRAHQTAKETPCAECKAARTEYDRARYRQEARTPSTCGTTGGYNRHRLGRTEVCDACRDARRTYLREWRAGRKAKVAS